DFDRYFESLTERQRATLHTKHYKGLGTSTNAEAAIYFKHLSQLCKPFAPATVDELKLLNLVGGTDARWRKDWLLKRCASSYVPYASMTQIPITDFINKEVIHYAFLSSKRSFPSV